MYLSVIVELCFERNKHVALNFSKFSDNISNRKVRKKVKKLDKKSRKSKKGVGGGDLHKLANYTGVSSKSG